MGLGSLALVDRSTSPGLTLSSGSAARAAAEPHWGDANARWPKARETSAAASAMPWPCVARGVLMVTATRPWVTLLAGVD